MKFIRVRTRLVHMRFLLTLYVMGMDISDVKWRKLRSVCASTSVILQTEVYILLIPMLNPRLTLEHWNVTGFGSMTFEK